MKLNRPITSLAALTLIGIAACGQNNVAGLPARDHSNDAAAAAAAPAEEAKADPRDTPAPDFNGRPMWSANRDHTPQENAQAAFERNGATFQAKSLDDFVAKVHAFTGHPPAGTETLKRPNGDTLFYNAAQNTFAVMTKDGAPRTMFKPDDGPAYWAKQKDQAGGRRASPKSKN